LEFESPAGREDPRGFFQTVYHIASADDLMQMVAREDAMISMLARAPASYVKLAALPGPQDPAPVVQALMRGDYFVTSGEVLIPSYGVQGTGRQRTIDAASSGGSRSTSSRSCGETPRERIAR
jgi:hypothetical protein